jgi:hypothetical protein
MRQDIAKVSGWPLGHLSHCLLFRLMVNTPHCHNACLSIFLCVYLSFDLYVKQPVSTSVLSSGLFSAFTCQLASCQLACSLQNICLFFFHLSSQHPVKLPFLNLWFSVRFIYVICLLYLPHPVPLLLCYQSISICLSADYPDLFLYPSLAHYFLFICQLASYSSLYIILPPVCLSNVPLSSHVFVKLSAHLHCLSLQTSNLSVLPSVHLSDLSSLLPSVSSIYQHIEHIEFFINLPVISNNKKQRCEKVPWLLALTAYK